MKPQKIRILLARLTVLLLIFVNSVFANGTCADWSGQWIFNYGGDNQTVNITSICDKSAGCIPSVSVFTCQAMGIRTSDSTPIYIGRAGTLDPNTWGYYQTLTPGSRTSYDRITNASFTGSFFDNVTAPVMGSPGPPPALGSGLSWGRKTGSVIFGTCQDLIGTWLLTYYDIANPPATITDTVIFATVCADSVTPGACTTPIAGTWTCLAQATLGTSGNPVTIGKLPDFDNAYFYAESADPNLAFMGDPAAVIYDTAFFQTSFATDAPDSSLPVLNLISGAKQAPPTTTTTSITGVGQCADWIGTWNFVYDNSTDTAPTDDKGRGVNGSREVKICEAKTNVYSAALPDNPFPCVAVGTRTFDNQGIYILYSPFDPPASAKAYYYEFDAFPEGQISGGAIIPYGNFTGTGFTASASSYGLVSGTRTGTSSEFCSVCIDADGDGFGEGCAFGPDCDDNNSLIHTNCISTTTTTSGTTTIPPAIVTGNDGSTWERVNEPGFGTKNNGSIVAMAEFQGKIYAVTRNDVSGFEIWRTTGDKQWEQVLIPGFTDSVLHEKMINVWSDLIVFQDKLYITVSSGYQGSKLYKSIGFEIWRYDGTAGEPVVSHAKGPQITGTLTGIASCGDADGSTTAQFSDSGAAWTADQFKGGILWITSGPGKGRVFDITGNTATSLTVQENESAGFAEDTICTEQTFTTDAPFPKYTIGAVSVGDSYKIINGVYANGFGQMWNKSIVDLEIYKGELYASVGFNYENGARVWKSADGMNWAPSSAYSMGSYHGYDPEGNPTGICLVPGQESRNGQPVSSSLPKFGKLVKDGSETLVIGGTGTQGCNGRGLRIFRLYDDGWKPIVDYFVDNNTTGTNENGIGDDGGDDGFFYSNFQAWSWAMHDGKLFTGIGRLVGGRIMYTPNAGPEDGNWFYAVGGDSAIQTEGFGYKPNIAFNIFALDNATLIAGSIEEESMVLEYVVPEKRGADIWRASGPADSLAWTQVTGNGFGDSTVIQFEAPLKTANGRFYISASSFGPSTPFPTTPIYGARAGYQGAIVYRLILDNCIDADGDTYGAGCTAGEDCDDTNSAIYQNLTGYVDADLDTYTVGGAVQVCSGASLPSGYSAAANGNDCDDTNSAIWANINGYVDADGDTYGAGTVQAVCSGAALPSGYVSVSGDCDDTSATKHPVDPDLSAPSGAGIAPLPSFTWQNKSPGTVPWYEVSVFSATSGGYVANQWFEAASICSGGSCTTHLSAALPPGTFYWWLNTYGATSCGLQIQPGGKYKQFTVTGCAGPTLTAPTGTVTSGTKPPHTFTSNAEWVDLQIYSSTIGAVSSQWVDATSACTMGSCSVTPVRWIMALGQNWWWVNTWSAVCGYQFQPGGNLGTYTIAP